MGFTTDLVRGLCQYLNDHGAGTYLATGSYADSAGNLKPGVTAPVYTLGQALDKPDRIIQVAGYSLEANAAAAEVVQPVQFMVRGTSDPTSANDDADAIYEVLQGLTGVTIGGIYVVQVALRSTLPMPTDAARRPSVAVNYAVRAMRPGSTRTD